jgi:2-dehydropantoate 2-reductase
MRICVVGAGSIDGLVGARLSANGEEVTLVARGPHFDAIRARGLRIEMADGGTIVDTASRVVARIADAGPHDVVIIGVKAHQVAAAVGELGALLHRDTMIVPMQNGIPWWYFQRHGGPHEGRHVESADPGGRIAAAVDPGRIVGCVVYPATEISAPGVIRHIEGDRFPLGEIDGRDGVRVRELAATFERAGLHAPVIEDIRSEIWLKLWGNLAFNPISALTHATLIDICQNTLARSLAINMMSEAQTIAEKLGARFRVPLEKRIAGAERVGHHKTSMLQDVEAGRATEVDALLGSVRELGALTETPTPHIDAVYACAKLLSTTIVAGGIRTRAAQITAKA